jgi:hypothetical protein
MMPIYNGLPFVISSDRVDRSNFRYIAEIFVGGNKIQTLKHNKNISASNRGIFDISRSIENFIVTTRSNFITYGFSGNTTGYNSYQVKFGEEYERYLPYTSIFSSAGYARFVAPDHDVRIGDGIMVQNSSNTAYNGIHGVIGTSLSTITTNISFVGNATGLIIEGEIFYDNYFVAHPTLGSVVGFIILSSKPTRINIGDNIVIVQSAGKQNAGYDGEWLVIDIYNVTFK